MAHIKQLPYDNISSFNLVDSGRLNATILNNLFSKYIENDKFNFSNPDYIPNIWECRWFLDDRVVGYNTGYCVWKNGIKDEFTFLSDYQDNLFNYVSNNKILYDAQEYFREPLRYWYNKYVTEATNATDMIIWEEAKQAWTNAMNGYVLSSIVLETDYSGDTPEEISSIVIQERYPPLYIIGQLNDDIEIYVSLIDNNKTIPGESQYWRKICKQDGLEQNDSVDIMYKELVETEIDLLFSNHINNYHYGISSDNEFENSQLSNFVLNDLSNFSIDNVYSVNEMHGNDAFINNEGFDVVKKFVRTPTTTTVNINGNEISITTYSWYKEWNSGYLEQGGTVTCDTTQPYTKIVLPIPYDTYPIETNLCIYGEYDTWLKYYNDTNTDIQYSEDIIYTPTLSNRYTIHVTPVFFNTDNSSELSTYNYIAEGVSGYNLNKNTMLETQLTSTHHYANTYCTTEVQFISSDSFCVTNNNGVSYYNYYTTGFRIPPR